NNFVKRKRITISNEVFEKVLNRIEASSTRNNNTFEKCKESVQKLALIQNFTKSLSSIQDKLKFNKVNANVAAVASSIQPNIVIEPIPEPPPVPPESPFTEASAEIINQLNALGETTFASLGLGGKSPVGLVQSSFEYLHVTLGIPWWEAIALGTLFIRLLMFPLVIIAQRNAARMNNYMPQLQAIQLKMTEARQMGNQLETARYSQELMIFMKEKQLNPLKNMIVPLAQMPVFISFFMALRQMANVPVDSLRTGGLWWFTDLTVPDQFFLMPLITSATLFATIELGTDSAKLSSQNLQTMKYVLRALPVIILPFIVNFPGAILCYWVSSNFISLIQVGVLRIPAVRDYFKIEPLITHQNLPVKPKGFTEGIKDSWTNIKITRELEERRKLDELQFQRAGKGPIVKTYKFDPTKQSSPTSISAKKR
ncbi:mitochondrial inner membrane protein OXA1L, partial [Asbolus verrucosus]